MNNQKPTAMLATLIIERRKLPMQKPARNEKPSRNTPLLVGSSAVAVPPLGVRVPGRKLLPAT
jgi:hypothetical protein